MADVHSKEVRSYNMSRIRSKDTKPELLVRKRLHEKGFRYRLHVTKLPGKPDIVLNQYKIVVFIHGCFWHGHQGCKYFNIPKTRREWWLTKIERTRELDNINNDKLIALGWRVVIINECQLKKPHIEQTISKLIYGLKNMIV